MINMDEYYKKIINVSTESKIKNTIKLNMYVNVLYIIVFFIALVFMIFGIIQDFSKHEPIFYLIGLAIIVIDTLILLSVDSKDPIKGYDVNDKVYVYMRFLRDEITESSNKINRLENSLKIKVLIIRVNRQLNIIEDNIKNAFIFQTTDYNENIYLIGKISNILRQKTINLVKVKKTKEVIALIDYIIFMYEFIIFNELVNHNECRKIISDRDSKIKELENLIDQIQEIEMKKERKNIFFKALKFLKNSYFSEAIIILSFLVLYLFKAKSTRIMDLLTFISISITIISAYTKTIHKNNT